MRYSWIWVAAAYGPVAACVPASQPAPVTPPAEAACSNDPLPAFVGRKASEAVGAEMLAASGARALRWVPPRTAVTMDFRADRLTVSYDDDMLITRASCG